MAEPEYELFAIRYATREARRSDHFIGGDPHDGPMPMDYFMWVAKGGGRTFIIDTGFNAEVSNKRKRTFLRCPVETLRAFDIDVNAVKDVILTHLHYDHAGNFDRFPNARFHLQEREMAYGTGRYMRPAGIRPGCNSFGSGPAVVSSCSPRMSAISTRTWRASGRSPRRCIS